MSSKSLISTDVDFDKDGKQFGNLFVPQSTNSAGWANYYVPIIVIRNGEGPTAVLSGGNHGDEYEGPVTLSKLARSLEPEQIQGRVIIIPMLNRPAVDSGTRLSPIDGANMNRSFPGNPTGTITSMIADFVANQVIPLADLVVDIHSGGSSMHMAPSVNMHNVADQEQMAKMIEAGRAWAAPLVFIYEDVAGAGLLPSYAEGLGKVTLGTEMGSKAQFGVETLAITELGVQNVLHWAGILKEKPAEAGTSEPQVVAAEDPRDYIMAPCSGIFEPFFELGDEVNEGEAVGQIHSLEQVHREPDRVLAQTSGSVIARRSIPRTAQGECVMVLVRPFG
ncbi:MAG: hypothetical protein CMJ78_19480 [Planctomycetaceae bacterium]|nr:hypothetical protein [Planctomycetaceae bacterium]